jgi:hypothetical protein
MALLITHTTYLHLIGNSRTFNGLETWHGRIEAK